MSERTQLGLAALAIVLATSIGAAPVSAGDALAGWTRRDLHLTHDAAACVADRTEGALHRLEPDDDRTAALAQHGVGAVPVEQRQLVGDIIVACALSTGPRS